MKTIEAQLRKQATEIAASGHSGWARLMIDSLEEIERLTAERDTLHIVAMAAEQWWRSLRPLDWDDYRHVANPCVNATSDTEQVLAIAVAKMMGEKG